MPGSNYFSHFKFLSEGNVEKVEKPVFRNEASKHFETFTVLWVDTVTHTEQIQSSQGCS